MRNETRIKFTKLAAHLATIYSVSDVSLAFNVEPSVQQKLEDRIQQSADFLTMINVIPVTEQEGEKIGLGVSGTIAGRTKVTNDNPRRPGNITAMESNKYRCEQTNFDHAIPYVQLDAWAKFADFQTRVRDNVLRRQALDRLMIGFNGVQVAEQTDRAKFPLLQDVNIGWLQQYRKNAPARVLSTGKKTAGKIMVGKGGDYANLDALVMDATAGLIDEVFQGDPSLVVICSRDMLHDKYFPMVNKDNPATEQLAGEVVVSQKRIGGLPAVVAPYMPPGTLLISPLANLSLYYQEGGRRRALRDEPDFNRVANYESSNDAYVVEEYRAGCLVENIELVPEAA